MRQKIASITQWRRLPTVCVLCQHYHRGDFCVCEACMGLFVGLDVSCRRCRLPLYHHQSPSSLCGTCLKSPPAFEQVLCAYSFEGPLRALLHQFKYKEALFLRSFLCKLLLDAKPLEDYRPDCFIPVPMHAKKLRQRGFNQAAELAKFLSKHMRLPYRLNLCEKTIHTEAQIKLNKKHRRENLKGAFRAKAHSYKHITLIDDLLTTGSTANALATALKQQGAERVDLWCVSRTPIL